MSHWFAKDNPRTIKLRSAVLLVAKNKEKRIKMLCTYIVENEAGDPEWMQAAATFVMQNGHKIQIPEIQVVGQNIVMGDPNLFKKKPVEAVKCDIRSFVCKEIGTKKDDAPDVGVDFAIYAKFSTDLWGWCGQQGGESFSMNFDGPPVPGDTVVANPEQQPTLELVQQEPDDEEEDEEEGDDEDPDSESEDDDEEDDGPGHRELTSSEEHLFQRSRSQSEIAAERARNAGIK